MFLIGITQADARTPAYSGPYLVFEAETGRVIESSKAFDPWYPASTTKMMTAYVTFEAIKAGRLTWTSPVVMSKHAASQPPSKTYLKAGTVLTVENTLKILMVKSANDLSVALAEAVSGSEEAFIAEMNAAAQKLGMRSTNFANPHGLPNAQQITTAYDLALLTLAIMRDYNQYMDFFSLPGVRLGKANWRNFNVLIDRYRGAIGFKTGYICSSGFNVVTGARQNGKTIIAIVMGARSGLERAVISKDLLDKGFSGRGIFGLGGVTLAQMQPSGPVASQAVDMRPLICKKPRQRPSAEELRARYGTTLSLANAIAPAGINAEMPRLNAASGGIGGENDGMDDVSTMDLLVGPRIRNQASIPISTGGATGPSAKVMSRWAAPPPIPLRKKDFVALTATRQSNKPLPGAIATPPASEIGALIDRELPKSDSEHGQDQQPSSAAPGAIQSSLNWPLRLTPPQPQARP
jgi:D-alanyl-D-alanine carboxypeptidase